jgi:hypothetical protein
VSRATTEWSPLVERGSALVIDAIREGRSRCTRGGQPKYIEQLAKDALNPNRDQSRCIEQVCALVIDIATRGELVDAEEIGLRLIALAREAFYAGKERPTLSLAEVHIAEEEAEGAAEDAETVMVHRRTRASYDAYLRRAAVHTSKRRDMDDVVRTLQLATV